MKNILFLATIFAFFIACGTNEDKRGYKAVQLGFGKIKNSKLTKSMKGYLSKKNTTKHLKIYVLDALKRVCLII